jgi:polyphosphate kinase
LTGYCELPPWRKLVVAPSRMQAFMIERIDQEAAMQRAGKGGRVIAKLNGLLEPAVIQALYRASQAGVQIDIVCRGISALRPGVPGVSENIRVTSIVDRFLEHSRIFYFGNGGDPQVYIGSADWMDRNLSRRVEVVWPVEQPDLKLRLIDELLATSLADNAKARVLLPDGSYRRVERKPDEPVLRSQARFLELAAATAARRQLPGDPLAGIPLPPPPDGAARPLRKKRRHRQTG